MTPLAKFARITLPSMVSSETVSLALIELERNKKLLNLPARVGEITSC